MLDILKPEMERIPAVRINYNVGCLFDIPTGTFVKGKYGEMILNGGLSACTGFVGKGNLGKSTVMHGYNAQGLARYQYSTAMTYDTEINLTESRMIGLTAGIEGFSPDNNPILDGRWNLSDKTIYSGNQWFEEYKKYVKKKIDNAKKITLETPFLDRDGKPFFAMVPTFIEIDSFSEFDTDDVQAMRDDNEIGEKGRLTVFMKQGLAKTGMISELPALIAKGNTPMSLTAHIGKEIPMDPHAPPQKTLQYLKNGDIIKGVTGKFNYLTTIAWQITSAVPLINDGTKAPEYPDGSDDNMKMDTDLTLVTVCMLRNKYGRSGLVMQVIVSQELGLLPSLSEFHYIKVNDRWGLDGNVQNYNVVFCPDIKLSRTAIRPKINKHPELRRALNILAEILQIKMLWTDHDNLMCTPQELYEDLKAMGYDWPTLLNTRGWWCFQNDQQPIPYLSSLDFLRMRKGAYKPYWWDDKKFPIDMSKAKA